MSPRRAVPLILALALLAGCAEDPVGATPVATERCGDLEQPQLQFGSHLIGDAEPPVPYSSIPPTSGWHRSGLPPEGVFDTPLAEPGQVATLEAGGVVITHHDLPADDLAALEAHLTETDVLDRVVLTPYDAIDPGTVALTSWGALQRCDGLDLAAVDAYIAAYANPIAAH